MCVCRSVFPEGINSKINRLFVLVLLMNVISFSHRSPVVTCFLFPFFFLLFLICQLQTQGCNTLFTVCRARLSFCYQNKQFVRASNNAFSSRVSWSRNMRDARFIYFAQWRGISVKCFACLVFFVIRFDIVWFGVRQSYHGRIFTRCLLREWAFGKNNLESTDKFMEISLRRNSFAFFRSWLWKPLFLVMYITVAPKCNNEMIYEYTQTTRGRQSCCISLEIFILF